MTFKYILKNFTVKQLSGNEYEYNYNDSDDSNFFYSNKKWYKRNQYILTCERCGNSSDPLHVLQDLKYKLVSHLVKNCHPSNASRSEQQQDQEEQQQQEDNNNKK